MKSKNSILVIHPTDNTTDFLKVVYQNLDCTVVNHNTSDYMLREAIQMHDTIIMLGHGFHGGLFGHGKVVINSTHVDILKNKKLVGIWCFANEFFERHGLLGIYSDMIISEMDEAMAFGVDCTYDEINQSNLQFALAVRDSIQEDSPIETFKQMYRSNENPVIRWNQDNFYYAYETYQLEELENNEQHIMDYNAMEEQWEMDNYNEMKDEQQ